MNRRLSHAVAAAYIVALTALPVRAQGWTSTKLNAFAVTNASGAMIVLGTAGSYNNVATATREAAYDGNTATFFDPLAANSQNAWAGFQLRSPKVVTRIRYIGRSGQAARMTGVLFQGANAADFADAVTLLAHTPPANWTGTTWIDATLSASTNVLKTFTYVRFIAPAASSYAGNMAECEFYGAEAASAPPAGPLVKFADNANWYAQVRWTNAVDAMLHELQRQRADESDFTTVQTEYYRTGETTWRDPSTLFNETSYRIRARNSAGDSPWFTFTAAARNAATGAWFGVQGSYNNSGMSGDKVFDANVNTFFDGPNASGGNNLWAALDLGSARAITGLRYTPRPDWASRVTGGQFQAADNADFTGAVTLHTIAAPPHYTNMAEVSLGAPPAYRYVRYLAPNGGWGNIAEVEFDLAASAPKAPIGLTFTSSDITNDFPVLAWSFDAQSVVSSSFVYRATAPGGPYAKLTPAGVFGRTWTDTQPHVGVLYYYRVSALAADAHGSAEGPLSAYAAYRRCERIERAWDNSATLKPGMTAFRTGTPYMGNANLDVDKLFDGSLSTFADITPSNCLVGVDLGKPYGIGKTRFSPRAGLAERVNGAVLRGSNENARATTLAALTNAVAGAYTVSASTNADAYRYVIALRLDNAAFYGNLAELELYGWDPDSLPNVMTAPLSVSFTLQAASLRLDWTPAANAETYRVERMPADGSGAWTEVGTTATTTLDDAAAVFGTRQLYRVVSLRGTESGQESAYSDDFPAVAYPTGAGSGLTGHYTANYTKGFRPDEALALVTTNATLDLTWASGVPLIPGAAASVSNVLIAWSGKLVVPHDGAYTFYATSDDGAALRLDGQFVINDWAGHAATTSTGTVTLATGQHDIRVDYFQSTGGGALRLEWGGAVARAVIPASQLIPAGLPPDDIGAWRGRTFNTPKLGYHAADPASGGIAVYSYGLDLSGATEGHHFVWQRIGGAFLLEAKVTQAVDPAATSAKALLMVRNGIESGSAFLAPARMSTGQLGYKARLTAGAGITDLLAWQGAPTNPCWLRVKRVGDTFTTQYKNSGGDWQTFHTFVDTNSVFNASMLVGFSVTSPATATTVPLQSAVFSEVRLTPLFGTMFMVR